MKPVSWERETTNQKLTSERALAVFERCREAEVVGAKGVEGRVVGGWALILGNPCKAIGSDFSKKEGTAV